MGRSRLALTQQPLCLLVVRLKSQGLAEFNGGVSIILALQQQGTQRNMRCNGVWRLQEDLPEFKLSPVVLSVLDIGDGQVVTDVAAVRLHRQRP